MAEIKLALVGYYGKSNFGDDFMAHWLPRVLTQNRQVKVQLYSDDAGPNILNGLKSHIYEGNDVVVIGGGEIVDPKFWAFNSGGIDRLVQSGKPVFFFNVNVYPEGLVDAGFVDKLRKIGAGWWVRDTYSVALLSEQGIQAQLLPDVSFRPRVIAHRLDNKQQPRIASVFLNHNAFMPCFHPKNVQTWLQGQQNLLTIAEHLDWLTSFGWRVNLIPAQTSRYVDDSIPSALVYALCRHKENIFWTKKSLDWRSTIKVIRNSGMILSQRYHSTTIALACGVPVVDITHHAKNAGLLNDIGLESLSAHYQTLCHQDLIDITAFAENVPSYQDRVTAYRVDARARWKQFDTDWGAILKNLERGTP